MIATVKDWRKTHRTSDARIQFNYPPNCVLIGEITEVVKQGYISVNPAGQELLDLMVKAGTDGDNIPSVLMVRVSLETGME